MNNQPIRNTNKQKTKPVKSVSKQKVQYASQLPPQPRSRGKINTAGGQHRDGRDRYKEKDNVGENKNSNKDSSGYDGFKKMDGEDGKISSKALRAEFDQIEENLKNRDISKAELQKIATQKLMNTLVKVYYQYSSLCQQAARIILQIYSHYPIRNKLHPKHTPNISNIIIPLFLHTYPYLNQSAVVQCIHGLVTQGDLNLLQLLKQPTLLSCSCSATNTENVRDELPLSLIQINTQVIIQKWVDNVNSAFINNLLELLLSAISESYKLHSVGNQVVLGDQKKKSKQQKIAVESRSRSKSKSQKHSEYSILLKYLVINLTKFFMSPPNNVNNKNQQPISLNSDSKHTILKIFYLYIDRQSTNIKITPQDNIHTHPHHSQTQGEQLLLLYKWAVLSTCQSISVNDTRKKKPIKYNNPYKPIFQQLLGYINDIINNSKYNPSESPTQPTQPTHTNSKIQQIINFVYSLLYPYCLAEKQAVTSLNYFITNQYKFLVLMNYYQLFLFLLGSVDLDDNVKEESIGVIVGWMFMLATYCDQAKKKHKLEYLLTSIDTIGLTNQLDPLQFQLCESILYRILISVQKCLPKYSLKHYDQLYINRPGIFHLYFIDQLLRKRQPNQVSMFLVELMSKWVSVDMRDFNVLGYVCKFMLYYLRVGVGNRKDQLEDRLKTLLTFFRELSPQALIHLNMIFYEASFSDQPSPQYSHSQQISNQFSTKPSQENSNNSSLNFTRISNTQQPLNLPPPPTLTCILPPLTLSSYQQESQLKACGYGCLQKSIFIDRNFYIGEELYQWSVLLREAYQDQFYYNCKYFYYLLTSAYSFSSIPPPSKVRMSTDNRQSLNCHKPQIMSKKIDKILELWEHSIQRNKVTQIQSIFQMLACWAHSTFSTKQPLQTLNQDTTNYSEPCLTTNHLKQILFILMEYNQKLVNLPNIYAQNWRQALKQMQTNNELFDNYKKQEGKIKNRQLYFMRSITKFIENIANKLFTLIPKSISYEHVVQVVQKYSAYGGGAVCWMSLRVLSQKMSRNLFIEEATTVLRHGNGLGKLVRKKLQLYRELIFAYIEEKVPAEKGGVDSKNSQNSRLSQNSQTRLLETLIDTELKLKISQIFQQCVQIFCDPVCPQSNLIKPSSSNFLKNQKQQLYNKLLALEIIQQVYNTALANKKSLKILHNAINACNSKDKGNKSKQKQKLLQKLRSCLIKIIFRNSTLVTKYERKLILHLRVNCINWVSQDRSLLLGDYFKDKKQGSGQICHGLINIRDVMLALWHYSLDQEVELRINTLSILTNIYKSEKYSCVQLQLHYIGAILTLISTLQPKPKLKGYADKFITANLQPIADAGYIFAVAITIGYLIYNSKVSLPCLDIFDTFCTVWVKGNKDIFYLLMSALEEIEKEGYRFKNYSLLEEKDKINLGTDLKLYYMNVKARKGWINCSEKSQSIPEDKSNVILKHLKSSIAEKNKNAKFLKSKKEAYFNLEAFLNCQNLGMMEKIPENQRRKLVSENQNTDDANYGSSSQIDDLQYQLTNFLQKN